MADRHRPGRSVLLLRLEDADKARLQAAADATGQTMSDLAIAATMAAVKKIEQKQKSKPKT